ncbi:autoinducer 2 ABC transporter substrate-binding protein [Paenibacillus doosanensis]|uniref:autoinducer 2 ABC transporter substrate-binding protein n=1 Tax=Paenibacillus doosanensis TaxID=1229154 RepID=UPI00217FFE4A|nr:autoinducer 2 ABC transporter substrate-binding protein [Paenibacillus doosanensis]MCS7460499.1 autoinducer 2 ABC transporter substrate-binding protein [Paenibacillus doosanensis]
MVRRMSICLLLAVAVLTACSAGGGKPQYEVIYTLDSPPPAGSGSAEETPQPPDGEKKSYTIGMVPKAMENPYFNVANDGAQEAAADLGVKVLFRGPQTADSDQQAKAIESLLASGVDLLAVSANDPERLDPVLRQAKEKGVKVITWDSDTFPESRAFFVNMVDPETLGRHLMDTMAAHIPDHGEFAVLTGSLSAASLNEFIQWIRTQQEQFYPNMKLVEVAPTDDLPQKAYEAASRLLKDHPRLAGIIGNSAIATPAAAQAIKEAGQAGVVKVVGLSTPVLIGSYLKDGSAQMATLWSPKRLGYLTVALAKQYLDGELPYNGEAVNNVGHIRVNGDKVIMGEPLDFTKQNAGQYDF